MINGEFEVAARDCKAYYLPASFSLEVGFAWQQVATNMFCRET